MKKMLVPIDLSAPQKKVNDFVYPAFVDDAIVFSGIKQKRTWKNAMVVYTGVDISVEGIFEKMSAAGKNVGSREETMHHLEKYLEQLSGFSIGNILEIERDEAGGFRLVKILNRVNLMGTNTIP